MSRMVKMLVLRLRASWTPAADADLHEVDRRHVGEIGCMEPRRCVHPLIEVLFLDVDVAVEMDNADALGGTLGNAAHAGKTN